MSVPSDQISAQSSHSPLVLYGNPHQSIIISRTYECLYPNTMWYQHHHISIVIYQHLEGSWPLYKIIFTFGILRRLPYPLLRPSEDFSVDPPQSPWLQGRFLSHTPYRFCAGDSHPSSKPLKPLQVIFLFTKCFQYVIIFPVIEIEFEKSVSYKVLNSLVIIFHLQRLSDLI